MQYYKIGELAKLTNNTIVTLRHYEKLGLLGKVKRSPGGFRLYSEGTISRVHFISNAKQVGFDLTEIKHLFALQTKRASSMSIKKKTQAKIVEIEQKIAMLTKMKTVLSQWEKSCDGKVSLKECPILKNLYHSSIED